LRQAGKRISRTEFGYVTRSAIGVIRTGAVVGN
jgi:hypothetical protein